MRNFSRFIPITKTDPDKRMVYGWASTNDLDNQGEIVSVKAIEKALPNYMKFPTLREMHQPKAIGVTKETQVISDKGLFIGAKIVNKDAWEGVKEGMFRGFSIGGDVKAKVNDTITDISLKEISLVDRPANESAVITLFKASKKTKQKVEIKKDFKTRYLKTLKGTSSTLMTKERYQKSIEIIEAFKKRLEVNQMEKKAKKTSPKKAKEEKKVEPKAPEVKAPEAEVKSPEPTQVVDEAKQTADQPSDLLKRMEKIEKSLVIKKKKKVEVKKVELLETSLVKVASVLEKLIGRVKKLEDQPAQPKTKASYIVEKDGISDAAEDNSGRKAEITKRLEKLMAIRQTNLTKFQNSYQDEAWKLSDELKSLGK